MENLSDEYVSNVSRPGLVSTLFLIVLGILKRVTGFFNLSEEDQLKAGIEMGEKRLGR